MLANVDNLSLVSLLASVAEEPTFYESLRNQGYAMKREEKNFCLFSVFRLESHYTLLK